MAECNDTIRVVGTTVRTALKIGGGILATRGIILTPDIINDIGGLAEVAAGVVCGGLGYLWSLVNVQKTVKVK